MGKSKPYFISKKYINSKISSSNILDNLSIKFKLMLLICLFSILDICLYTLIGGTIYILITYKMGIINRLFGKKMVNRVLKYITFGKIQIKE